MPEKFAIFETPTNTTVNDSVTTIVENIAATVFEFSPTLITDSTMIYKIDVTIVSHNKLLPANSSGTSISITMSASNIICGMIFIPCLPRYTIISNTAIIINATVNATLFTAESTVVTYA